MEHEEYAIRLDLKQHLSPFIYTFIEHIVGLQPPYVSMCLTYIWQYDMTKTCIIPTTFQGHLQPSELPTPNHLALHHDVSFAITDSHCHAWRTCCAVGECSRCLGVPLMLQ